jgi:hypothetical protein
MTTEKPNSATPGFHLSQNTIMLLFLILFALISITSSANLSVTLDEPQKYHYGLNILHGDSYRNIDSAMPISVLNAFPAAIASLLPEGTLKSILERFAIARLITIVVSMFVAYLVFFWSRSLYGFIPAIFSFLLFIFDPNIIAHSQLVSTDLYILGVMSFTFYRLWLFANNRNLKNGLMFLLAFGISQIVKYTAITLFPLCLITLFLHDWREFKEAASSTNRLFRFFSRYIEYTLAAIVISVLVINIGFLFNRTFTRFGDYQFRSDLFIKTQSRLFFLKNVPVPVPYPYLEGLDWMIHTEKTGDTYGNIYLLGQLAKQKGFPGYYFIASLLKVPIASQIILAASFIAYFFNRNKRRKFLYNEVFFFVPILFFSIYFNFFFNTQIGIRYYLVIFPLLYIFSGNLFVGWEQAPITRKILSMALMIYLAVSVLSYFPYYIPYFNELVWDKTQTYKYLSDSNLDFGQGKVYLERYLSSHPGAIYSPDHIQPGTLIVSGSDLVGILEDPNKYAWLRKNYEPVDTIAYCYFIYKITPQEIEELCASTEYCKQQP